MKMKHVNVFAKVQSFALAIAMLCSVCVLAAAKTDSNIVSWDMGKYKYAVYSTLYTDNGTKGRAATWVQVLNNQSVPTGYMKAKAFLYDATGSLRKSTILQSNITAAKYLFVVTPTHDGAGEYYTIGEVSLYGHSEFRTSKTLMTTNASSNAMADIRRTLDKNGDYPVNAQGQTYGSALLAEVVGYKPDLIAATGTNNLKGYVRMDELDPFTATPLEAAALAASSKDSVLPLYDLSGKVIGTFVQDVGVSSNNKDFVGSTFDAAQTKVDAGSYTTPARTVEIPKTKQELAELAARALTITPYSRNSTGQTYGSESMHSPVGYPPDLIAIMATNGRFGYAKYEEVYPPIGIIEKNDNQSTTTHGISVYNLEAEAIGEFKFEPGGFSAEITVGKSKTS